MKKYIAVLLIFSLCFLCACGIPIFEKAETTTAEPVYYTDANGKLVPALEGAKTSVWDAGLFVTDEQGRVYYDDSSVVTKTGIDVSEFQGEIDWQAVADDGIDFVMLRVGCRGYGPSGFLLDDDNFESNYEGAKEAGLSIGVYYFSQALNAQEAQEEAEYVLSKIRGKEITYPVAYDWEFIDYDTARTDDMTGEEITVCAEAFCNTIESAGYKPVIYFSCELGYFNYDLSALSGRTFWLAEYAGLPSFYYDFEIWQYTKTGTVDGIDGNVDINIYLSK